MKNISDASYNERLFSGGVRNFIHSARFRWLRKSLLRLGCEYQTVLELGCFDGRSITYLPHPPKKYSGFDANWEGGLVLAMEKWKAYPNYHFSRCQTPAEMELGSGETFDIAVIMETLEHIPPGLVDGYLAKIAEHTQQYLFVTVPNEMGFVFLLKWLVKRIFSKDSTPYSFSEFVFATLGRTDKVSRREHKGFNYKDLARQIDEYFDIVRVEGFPFGFLPHSLCINIGLIARKKANRNV